MAKFDFDVFISYSHEDHALAGAFADWLRVAGLSVWLDEEQLVPGTRFRAGLQQGIRESRHMVAILTPSYCQRLWTQRELDLFDLAADYSERRLVAVQVGDLSETPLDQVFLVHQRVGWSGRFLELDPEGLWRVYCGLTGQRPGARAAWAAEGRKLVASLTAESSPAVSAGSVPQRRSGGSQPNRVSVRAEPADGAQWRHAIAECLNSPGSGWTRLFDQLRGDLVSRTDDSARTELATTWWAAGYAESAAALGLLSLPSSTWPSDAWAFLDLDCPEVTGWLLTRTTIEALQPSELWFSWAVAQRAWTCLPGAARLVPTAPLREHFLTFARPALTDGVRFHDIESNYDYGVMITPWNHFHLSWLAVRLGDVEAASSHALMLCSTTVAGDPRTGRFLNRLTTWDLFATLRSRHPVGAAIDQARAALGLLPTEAVGAVRHRLVDMWRYVKSLNVG